MRLILIAAVTALTASAFASSAWAQGKSEMNQIVDKSESLYKPEGAPAAPVASTPAASPSPTKAESTDAKPAPAAPPPAASAPAQPAPSATTAQPATPPAAAGTPPPAASATTPPAASPTAQPTTPPAASTAQPATTPPAAGADADKKGSIEESTGRTVTPETKGVMQPQGPTGPIETKSGGAPAASPQGQTPPGMQSAPEGSSKTTVEPAGPPERK